MIAIRAPVTTNVDCPTKIGQKCFCAVRDKHLFHISFNEALLIGAANSLVSENNPESIDSVRKSITNRPFLRISENFRKENTETNQTKKNQKNPKRPKKNPKETKNQKNQRFGNLSTYSNIWPDLWFFCFFVFLVFCFFCFFVFFVFFGFASCLGFNPLYCLGSLC